MDVTLEWARPATDPSGSLYKVLCDAHSELQQAAFAKWGRAKRVSCDVHAHVNNVILLSTCSEWKPAVVFDPKHHNAMSELVGTMGDLTVYIHRIMGVHVIRLVADFDVNDDVNKTLYGNVRLSA